jgi:hypothetical protein
MQKAGKPPTIYQAIDDYTNALAKAKKIGLVFTPSATSLQYTQLSGLPLGTWDQLDSSSINQEKEIKNEVEEAYRKLLYVYEQSKNVPTQKYDAFIEMNQTIIDTTSIILGVVGVTLGVINMVQYHLQKKK